MFLLINLRVKNKVRAVVQGKVKIYIQYIFFYCKALKCQLYFIPEYKNSKQSCWEDIFSDS